MDAHTLEVRNDTGVLIWHIVKREEGGYSCEKWEFSVEAWEEHRTRERAMNSKELFARRSSFARTHSAADAATSEEAIQFFHEGNTSLKSRAEGLVEREDSRG